MLFNRHQTNYVQQYSTAFLPDLKSPSFKVLGGEDDAYSVEVEYSVIGLGGGVTGREIRTGAVEIEERVLVIGMVVVEIEDLVESIGAVELDEMDDRVEVPVPSI
jgi:hypothetical protein